MENLSAQPGSSPSKFLTLEAPQLNTEAFSSLATDCLGDLRKDIERIGESALGDLKLSYQQIRDYVTEPPGWMDPSKAKPAFFSFVKSEGNVVGYAFSMNSTTHPSDTKYYYEPGDCYLTMINIEKRSQGQGLMRPLIKEHENIAKELGFSHITMHATVSSGFSEKALSYFKERVVDQHFYQDPFYGAQLFLRASL